MAKTPVVILLSLVGHVICVGPAITTTNCPDECKCQGEDNSQVDCSKGVIMKPPMTSSSTMTLDLSENSLGPIIKASFPRMSNLTELDLSYNGIRRLLGCTFNGMLSLNRLSLRGNRLTSMPDSLFTDAAIEHLDLSHNIFTSIPDHVFRNANNLKTLDLSNNRLVELKLGPRFQVLRFLHYLDLSHNLFESVSEDSFAIANQWEVRIERTLKLSHCKLTQIQAGALTQIPDLNDLDLSGNPGIPVENLTSAIKELERQRLEKLSLASMNLTDIQSFFTQVTLLALKFLNVSSNHITSIPSGMFSTIRSLKVLDLSHNKLTSLGGGIKDLSNLIVLNMSSNALTSFKGRAVNSLDKVEVLDLSDNRLSTVSDVKFRPLIKLKQLKVSNNLLPSVILPQTTNNLITLDYSSNSIRRFGGFSNVPKLESFDISDNDLEKVEEFIFKQAYFMKKANFSGNSITEIDPRAFLPQSPLAIDLSHNFLEKVQFSNWVATQEFDLSHNQITSVDMQTFHRMTGLRVLDLSENNITSLHEDLFVQTVALQHLNLSHNSLTHSNLPTLFRHLRQLKTLDLGGNNISQFEEKILEPVPQLRRLLIRNNKLEILMPRTFRDLMFIQEIDLSDNPFSCLCDLLALRDWLSRTRIAITGLYSPNSSAYLCHSPASRLGKHLMKWEPGQFECDEVMLYMIVFGSIGLTLIVAGVISTIVHRLYRRHHRKQKEMTKARLEIERLGESLGKSGKKSDLKRMTSEEIAEEITNAIERRERKGLSKAKAAESKHENGYVPWLAGKKNGEKTKERDNRRTDTADESSGKIEKTRTKSPERHYDHLMREEGGKMELKDRDKGRRGREREARGDQGHDGRRDRGDEYIDVDGGVIRLRRDKPLPAHPPIFYDRGHYSDQEHHYRTEAPRRGDPYFIAGPPGNRWDAVESWDRDTRDWIMPGHRRSRSQGHRRQREGNRYLTMPIRDQDYLRARSQDRDRRGKPAIYLDRYTNEIRYGVEDLRRYPSDPRRSRRDLHGARSRSYHQLPLDQRMADEGSSSQNRPRKPSESAHNERRPWAGDRNALLRSRAISQPFLANEHTSEWL